MHSRSTQETLLVVDDDPRSQRQFRLNLEPLGYHVLAHLSALGSAEVLAATEPDLVILELQLADGNGIEVCQTIRAISLVPIIIVSAISHVAEKVRALQLGADDYVTKPYDPVELAARIGAVLRRVGNKTLLLPPMQFSSGPLTIDFEQRQVRMRGREIRLSRTEYSLLEYLATNVGRTLVAGTLLAKVWGPDYRGEYAQLHLYISRLRHKLGEDSRSPSLIITKPGIGYMLVQRDASTILVMQALS